jgi:3-hydroxyacyl-CoA dehydrogenase/enoyl-CoA hydratase/3-hydroxybutyryl-CoA epimerase
MTAAMMSYQVDHDGIATLIWNDSEAPVNSMSQQAVELLAKIVDEVISDDSVKGVILTSGKTDFVVGANLKEILTMKSGDWQQDAGQLSAFIQRIHGVMRKMETAGKPFVAALNGTALGGGLELALACHHRIAASQAKARFGFPEVNLGLLPGAGGTQRLPRMLGIEKALPWLMQATQVGPAQAQAAGIIDEVVEPEQLLPAARQWLLDNPQVLQPWDVGLNNKRSKFRMPGGEVQSAKVAQTFMGAEAMLRKKTYGNYAAPQAILEAVYEGCQVPFDQGLAIETRGFVRLLLSDQAKALIRTFFTGLQQVNKLKHRPVNIEKRQFTKIGILGAGMMGAGIAYSASLSGLGVVLLDTDQNQAEQGKAYSEKLLKKRLARGKTSQEKVDAQLARILPTTDFNDLAGCDLVIEAVFEDRHIKAEVTAKAEAVLGSDALMASNTSTLPITSLADACQRPEQFIGLHFFSPVDKMPLVEIIVGEKTSQQSVAWALDFVQQLRKTPIVVNDSRGFYTSRVFKTYVLEGMALLNEGVAPALIENAGKMAGMPVGPLALSDEVSMELMDRIARQTQADLGDAYTPHPGDEVVDFMVHHADRIGKKAGRGFYDYPAGEDKALWPGLSEAFVPTPTQPEVEQVMQRLLYAQAVEALHCVSEGVISQPHEVDIGSIYGWGFAPHTGGILSFVETIEGFDAFIARADALVQGCGDRFRVPHLVRELAETGGSFYAS